MDGTEDQVEQAVPTYDEAFPALPEPDEKSRITAEAHKATWATSAIKPSVTTQVFTIDHDELKDTDGDALGKKQSVFKLIADATGTSISRSVSKDKSVTVTVSGKAANVAEARRQILDKLQTEVTQEVAVPRELHRFIIGSEGKVLKEIEASTKTKIQIPHSADPKTTISVRGAVENVRKATAQILAISNEQAKKDTIRLTIPKAYHNLIAGGQRVLVRAIQEKTGAQVNIPPGPVEKDEIVVTGEKPGVGIAAQQILDLYEQLQKTCGQMTVTIKKSQHRYIIGTKGAAIHEVYTATGVIVEVPGHEDASENVVLRGPQEQLAAAANLIFERANRTTSEIIKIPEWLHRHVIGKGGVNLKQFAEVAPKVRVDFSKDSDDIALEGPPEEVNVLKTALLTLAGELSKALTHVDKKIDVKVLPHLIGRGGSIITQLCADSGAGINVMEKAGVIRIVGSDADVKKASAAIDELIRKQENMRSVDVIVPQRFHASLIGPSGATIRSITDAHPSCTVLMPKGDSEIVLVRGDKKDVEGAEKMIRKLLKQFEEEGFQLEVPVFKEFHRQIIGRQGAKVKEISEQTSTRLKFPDEDSDSNVIVIIGRQKNCEAARDLLIKIQGELANVVTEELDIDSRFHAAIIGPKGRVVNSIMQECGGVSIHFPSGPAKAKRPNVVTVKGPSEDVAKAKARLLSLANAETLNSQTEEVKVKREFLRFLIGRAGAERTKIQDATKARLFFPRVADGLAPADDDDVITIVGTKEACAAAKAKLLERVAQLENTVEATVNIDPVFYKDFVANRGRFFRDLAEEFGGVSIVLPRSTDGKYVSDVVHVKGSKEDVPKTIERLQQFVEDVKSRVTVEVSVASDAIPVLMGPGGSNVNKVCAEFNVSIKVPERRRGGDRGAAKEAVSAAASASAEEPSADGVEREASVDKVEDDVKAVKTEIVRISGTQAACDAAIAALIPVEEALTVDAKHFPSIIGEKGAKISQLQKDTNVRARLSKSTNQITLLGSRANIALAKERLAAIVADLEAKSFSVSLEVDPKHVPTLIGPRGAAARDFRAKYNVELQFPSRNADSEEPAAVVVSGYEKDVLAARDVLAAKIQELDSLVTLELSIDPRVQPRVLGQRGAAVKALQDKHKVRINFPRERGSWQVTVVGPAEGAEEAKNALETSADDFMQDILDEEQLQQYVKETPSTRHTAARPERSEPFQVRNAPWQGTSADFPGLGSGAAAAAAPKAWGRKA